MRKTLRALTGWQCLLLTRALEKRCCNGSWNKLCMCETLLQTISLPLFSLYIKGDKGDMLTYASNGGATRQRTPSSVSSAAPVMMAPTGPLVGPLHRFLQFNAALSGGTGEVDNELQTLPYWRSLVSSTFAPESLRKFKLYNSESRQEVKNMGNAIIGFAWHIIVLNRNMWQIRSPLLSPAQVPSHQLPVWHLCNPIPSPQSGRASRGSGCHPRRSLD